MDLSDNEIQDLAARCFCLGAADALEKAGRDPYNDSSAFYMRELHRWAEEGIVLDSEGPVNPCVHSDEALAQLRWG